MPEGQVHLYRVRSEGVFVGIGIFTFLTEF
jgi:hypothetical protein